MAILAATMGLRDAFNQWRAGRNISSEVAIHVEVLLRRVEMTRGPGQGIELRKDDPVEMLAVTEILTKRHDLDVMQFAGTLQLCFKAARDRSMTADTKKLLESHNLLTDDPRKISLLIPE